MGRHFARIKLPFKIARPRSGPGHSRCLLKSGGHQDTTDVHQLINPPHLLQLFPHVAGLVFVRWSFSSVAPATLNTLLEETRLLNIKSIQCVGCGTAMETWRRATAHVCGRAHNGAFVRLLGPLHPPTPLSHNSSGVESARCHM